MAKPMKLYALFFVASIQYAQPPGQADLYPLVRTLVQEAERATVQVQFLDDRSNPRSWASRLYARAGYLNDAVRANGGRDDAYQIWRARVLYGDLAGGERTIESMPDPEQRALALVSLADFLWRMGDADKAQVRFEAARQLAPKIANPEHRKRVQMSIEQGLTYLPNDPPERLSPQPNPPAANGGRRIAGPAISDHARRFSGTSGRRNLRPRARRTPRS